MKQIWKFTARAIIVMVLLLNTMDMTAISNIRSMSAGPGDSIEYQGSNRWETQKTVIQKGDCILLLKERNREAKPHEWENRREDSFYCEPYIDSTVSRYSCDPVMAGRLWRMADSVKGWMEAVIIREDTELGRKYFGGALKDPKDSIPIERLLSGLKRIQVHEYRFKDIKKARASFRLLAYEPNVVMRGDTGWLHGDGGTFYIQGDMVDTLKKRYPHEAFYALYHEQWGLTAIECDKAFYDKFNLYTKRKFIRPKRFSFVIYKKME